jgi:hypothetical protein
MDEFDLEQEAIEWATAMIKLEGEDGSLWIHEDGCFSHDSDHCNCSPREIKIIAKELPCS